MSRREIRQIAEAYIANRSNISERGRLVLGLTLALELAFCMCCSTLRIDAGVGLGIGYLGEIRDYGFRTLRLR